MKRLAVALVTGLALSVAGFAEAAQCPVLIKQGRDAAAKLPANDPKARQALAKLDEAQKLHETGRHADSVKAANEALSALGVR